MLAMVITHRKCHNWLCEDPRIKRSSILHPQPVTTIAVCYSFLLWSIPVITRVIICSCAPYGLVMVHL